MLMRNFYCFHTRAVQRVSFYFGTVRWKWGMSTQIFKRQRRTNQKQYDLDSISSTVDGCQLGCYVIFRKHGSTTTEQPRFLSYFFKSPILFSLVVLKLLKCIWIHLWWSRNNCPVIVNDVVHIDFVPYPLRCDIVKPVQCSLYRNVKCSFEIYWNVP